jgi:hypothetical protein
LGAASVQLRPSLRQGRPGVFYDDDVDIVLTEVSKVDIFRLFLQYNLQYNYLHCFQYLPDTTNSGGISTSSSHSSDLSQLASSNASTSSDRTCKTSVVGKLHLRITNVGRKKAAETLLPDPHIDTATLRKRDPYSKESVVVRDHQLAIMARQQVVNIPKRVSFPMIFNIQY